AKSASELLAVYAVIGGLIAALLLWIVGRIAARAEGKSFLHSCGTGLVALGVHGACVLVALFIFHRDALITGLNGYTSGASTPTFVEAVAAFVPLQLPGLLLAGLLVTLRAGRPYRGV